MMVILENFMPHFLICFKHILRLNARLFPFPSPPTPVVFEITFSISSRHMNYIWYNGKLVWIRMWLYVENILNYDRCFILLLGVLAWNIRLVSDSIIFWGQSWTQLHSRKIVDESLGIELHSILRQTIILYKVSSSMDLERILTKDISPESFKDSPVDSTRHYFGPTRKIYVYSGVLCACPHLMCHTYILGSQFWKDPVWCTFSTSYHKLEEHRS